MHSAAKAPETWEASHSSHGSHASHSSKAEAIIMSEKVVRLVLSVALAFLTVSTTILFIHPLASEAEPTHHEIFVIKEVREGISAAEEVSEYVLRMLEREMRTVEARASSEI
jgi:hypothetical protein